MEMGRNISFSVLSGLHPMEMKYLYTLAAKAVFIRHDTPNDNGQSNYLYPYIPSGRDIS